MRAYRRSMDDTNIDTSPETDEDTASGGAAEPRKPEGEQHDTATGVDAPRQDGPPQTTDDDGTPVENPAG